MYVLKEVDRVYVASLLLNSSFVKFENIAMPVGVAHRTRLSSSSSDSDIDYNGFQLSA